MVNACIWSPQYFQLRLVPILLVAEREGEGDNNDDNSQLIPAYAGREEIPMYTTLPLRVQDP